MDVGDRVRIENTGTAFDGKEGVIEEQLDDVYTIYVDFIPDDNKRIRQNFNAENILPIEQTNIPLGEGKGKKVPQNASGGHSDDDCTYDTSSLSELGSALGENSRKMLSSYPYKFKVFVSDKFIDSYNFLRDTLMKDEKSGVQFFKAFDRAFAQLNDNGVFTNASVEKVQGLPNKYDGSIKELKLGSVNGKPIRVLFFMLPNKQIVLGNVFYHKREVLTNQERNSINDIFDKVKKGK